jgi:hypothetical protein
MKAVYKAYLKELKSKRVNSALGEVVIISTIPGRPPLLGEKMDKGLQELIVSVC